MTDSVQADDQLALSFVVCVSDREALQTNLLSSPCLQPGSVHEVIAIENCPSAADGLNLGLERAQHGWVACVHQDVCLPAGWDQMLASQIGEAERRFGPIGVAGVYGVGGVIPPHAPGSPLAAERLGWVVDRGRWLRDGPELPARVATLDELLLVVRRDAGLRFDPELGFHLYGADICLQAREQGLAVVALAAPCDHNSRSAGLPRHSSPARRSSPASGRTGSRLPRPAQSSPRGRGSHPRQCHGQAGVDRPHLREPRPASSAPSNGLIDAGAQSEQERGELAMSGTARRAPLRHAGHG